MNKWNKYNILNKTVLLPYYLILLVRHALYDRNILKSRSFDIPVISVGNITVGGTGKTPYISYLIGELQESERIAVLSRGYGRKSKGFRIVEVCDSAIDVGDEPLMLKKKHPSVIVAVDKNRCRGIEKLMAMGEEKPSLILLDDGFQHRKVKPSTNVVLISCYRPIHKDYLLPLGRLRDLPSRLKRADEVVITKCPDFLSAEDKQQWRNDLSLTPNQILSFMRVNYLELKALFPQGDNRYIYSKEAILITGIASPKAMTDYLSGIYKFSSILQFSDHHFFSKKDIHKIQIEAERNVRAIIITTEKDVQRLIDSPYLSKEIVVRLFYLPVEFVSLVNEVSVDKY